MLSARAVEDLPSYAYVRTYVCAG